MRPVLALEGPARLFYAAFGWCAVTLAIAGVLVPGLPTTVFVLLASYCFSKSSPRFEWWLRQNRWFGPRLHGYISAGGLTSSAKRAALAAMWTSVLVSSGLLVSVHGVAALFAIGLGAVGTMSILFGVRTVPEKEAYSRPTRGHYHDVPREGSREATFVRPPT